MNKSKFKVGDIVIFDPKCDRTAYEFKGKIARIIEVNPYTNSFPYKNDYLISILDKSFRKPMRNKGFTANDYQLKLLIKPLKKFLKEKSKHQ